MKHYSRDLPFTRVFSRALSLCFRYRWVCVFFPLSNIWLSYLLLLRIPFGVLLLSIARQLINMDHTVGSAALPRRRNPRHTLGPSLALEPHLAVGPFLYLPAWKITPGTRRTQQRKRGRKKRAMRSRVVRRGPTRQEINSPQIFN